MQTFEYQLKLKSPIDNWVEDINVSVRAVDHIDACSKIGSAITFLANNLEVIESVINNYGK